jgi:hypothetical protein
MFEQQPRYLLRRQMRMDYTWQAIYDRAIRPLLAADV